MRIKIKEKRILKDIISQKLDIDLSNDISGISIDSRQVEEGDLFLALKGDKCHGADFINDDILNKIDLVISDKYISSSKALLVESSNDFLRDIAFEFRKKLKLKIIGITGTNGKTSTKELLVRFLKTKFKVNYSKGNYNSTISLPLSILSFDSNADYCVLEMGASKNGEIQKLCNIAKPDIGLVTNISEAHLEGYSDFSQLINTKLALYESVVNNNGTCFLNIDDTNIKIKGTNRNIETYSCFDDSADYFGDMSQIKDGLIYINNYLFNATYKSLIFGSNFLASFSIASSLGVCNQSINDCLEDFCFPSGRGTIIRQGDSLIIDDTYNANLGSMKSGISELKILKNNRQSIVLILGDMLDLGNDSKRHHSELGEYIGNLNFIDTVLCIGKASNHIIENIKNDNIRLKHFRHAKSAISFLKEYDFDNKIFYFKGSRGMYMEKIIQKVFN